MNPAAWQEPVSIFEDLDRDDDVRVVVIAGKGPCFSAGIDLVEMIGGAARSDKPGPERRRKMAAAAENQETSGRNFLY